MSNNHIQKNLKKNYFTSIKKKYKNYKYGIGLEHEMYYFHFPMFEMIEKKPIKTILLAPTEGYQYLLLTKDKFEKQLSKSVKNIIKNIPYEPTGRICNGHVVLDSLPGIWASKERMPEFITDKPISIVGKKERKLFNYTKELKDKESNYAAALQRVLNKYFDNKINKYGDFIEPPFGMSSFIKLPSNYRSPNYKFRKGTYTDYCGSYHVTLTLPYGENIKRSEFIKMHQNFANMIQWIEPLLITAYFSADDRSMGTVRKRVRGSFRVMRIGWGNFAGSDVRKFNKGIGRYANIIPYWRKGLKFTDQKLINYCQDLAPAIKRKEPGAKSGFSSNFRTFGSTDPARPQHRESGVGMTVGNGIELRIFDHFPIRYLNSLLQLIACVAENSRVFHCKNYVYQDKDWIDTMHQIMTDGWYANLRKSFINKLRKNLGLKIKTFSNNAYDIMKTIYDELYDTHKDGDFAYLLMGSPKKQELPQINKQSWEFGLSLKINNNDKLLKQVNRFLSKINNSKNIKSIEKIFFNIFSVKNWKNSFCQFMFYLESIDVLSIDIDNQHKITAIYKDVDVIDFNRINLYIAEKCYMARF